MRTSFWLSDPKDAGGFYTIEDAAKNILAYGRAREETGVAWRRIDTQKVIAEKRVRQSVSRVQLQPDGVGWHGPTT